MEWTHMAVVVGIAFFTALQAVRAAGVAAPAPARISRGRSPRRA
ncbi:MAG TPA: hypothetical protein VFM53_03545 [Anaeromyxobacteraceae bacterium]|nr:hypothetical protein [Anaeromyxobacteraceae bacterium]